jgi:extracellular matrix protein 14
MYISDVGYRGEKPFQAVETELMSTYIHKTLSERNIQPVGYVDFHSYSQSILYPFAYDCDVLPRDAEDLAEAAWGAAKAARDVHGRYFDVDSACEGDNFANTKVQTLRKKLGANSRSRG